jgi:hypothetical protein
MNPLNRTFLLSSLLLAIWGFPGQAQISSNVITSKIDALITEAYQSATAQFPCKLSSAGKPKMLRWQSVEKCLNYANDRVEWDTVSEELKKIRKEFNIPVNDMSALVDTSLSAHAVPYDKVFIVKATGALLPLSSSLLKFMPESSLQDLPVFSKAGTQVGTFSGIYSFEKSGELSGNLSRRRLFQYTDAKGGVHGSPEKLLLDSFGVPWKGAASQPGFRLPSDRIVLK